MIDGISFDDIDDIIKRINEDSFIAKLYKVCREHNPDKNWCVIVHTEDKWKIEIDEISNIK